MCLGRAASCIHRDEATCDSDHCRRSSIAVTHCPRRRRVVGSEAELLAEAQQDEIAAGTQTEATVVVVAQRATPGAPGAESRQRATD